MKTLKAAIFRLHRDTPHERLATITLKAHKDSLASFMRALKADKRVANAFQIKVMGKTWILHNGLKIDQITSEPYQYFGIWVHDVNIICADIQYVPIGNKILTEHELDDLRMWP